MSKFGWHSVCSLSLRLRSVLFHHNNYLMPINIIVFFPIIKVAVDDSPLHKDSNRSVREIEKKKCTGFSINLVGKITNNRSLERVFKQQ